MNATTKKTALAAAACPRPTGYEVMNLRTGQSHGVYKTLDEARGCVAYDRLTSWQIWSCQQTLIEERDRS